MKNLFYNKETKELNDDEIIKAIKDALLDYENGDILVCADTLVQIVRAIKRFERDY